jgi:hypothetical protein
MGLAVAVNEVFNMSPAFGELGSMKLRKLFWAETAGSKVSTGVKLVMPQPASDARAAALHANLKVTVPIGSISGAIDTGTPLAQLLRSNTFDMQEIVSGVLLASVNVYVMLKLTQWKPVSFCPSKQTGTPSGQMFVGGVPVGVKAPEKVKLSTAVGSPGPFRMMVGSMGLCALATATQAKTNAASRIARFIDIPPSGRQALSKACTPRAKQSLACKHHNYLIPQPLEETPHPPFHRFVQLLAH